MSPTVPCAPRTALLRLLPLLLLATACGKQSGAAEPRVADVLARERAAQYFSEGSYKEAFEEIQPLVERKDPSAEDLVRAGQCQVESALESGSPPEAARPYFERAIALEPDDPAAVWGLFSIAYGAGDYEAALPYAQRVHALAPKDYPTELALANTYQELERWDDARPLYEDLARRGFDEGGSWYVSVVHRLHWNLVLSGKDPDEERWLHEEERLKEEGIDAPDGNQQRRGSFGELAAPPPGELAASAAERRATIGDGGEPTRFEPEAPAAVGGITGIALVRVQDEPLPEDALTIAHPIEPRALQALLWGPGGLRLARRTGPGTWDVRTVLDEPVSLAADLEVDPWNAVKKQHVRDGVIDLLAVTARGLELLVGAAGADGNVTWTRHGDPLLGPDFPVSDLAPVDYDHEGDLDVLAVGPKGVRLLRNDGVPAPGAVFTDVTAESGLPTTGSYAWCAIADVDVDQDVDLLLGGPAGAFYAKNARGGHFDDASSTLPEGLAREPAIVDVDRDRRPDLVVLDGTGVRVLLDRYEDRWALLGETTLSSAEAALGAPVVGDLADVDQLRALWGAQKGVTRIALRPPGVEAAIAAGAVAPDLVARGDVTGDGVDDLVVSDGSSLSALVAHTDDHCVRLELEGVKDNRRGVGALVELRAGPMYQSWFWDGHPRSFSVGASPTLDVLRVTWPDGVVQTQSAIAAPGAVVVKQKPGLIGSCPFLYAWNGTTYGFVTDVLGITPLGLPIDLEHLVPPDHDEYVLVRGDQLVPKDGVYELQLTEELREVTYLDRARLDVVDHPADVEVYPNERFDFPPFPEPHTHTVKDPLAPAKVTDQEGRDWTAELASIDDRIAKPFVPMHGQFQGLADPHWLELSFDPERVRAAPKLRLLMTGWLFWTDASVNVASAVHPDVEFVPPVLSVPDGQGGWRDAGPPLGFPAGKMKTMVVDVTAMLDRDDPRIRISSTLALYWDSIRLAVDADDAPLVTTPLEPASARLWERGFSQPIATHGGAALDWFEWDHMTKEPRWNQHPGLYTRLGDVEPLVTAIDDCMVVMGSGDALTLRFDASALPPLKAGWTRDYLLFLDGWAKDRDPNTKDALYVEPLPFHGMSAYPYGPDEHFPDTPATRAWRRDYQTRPAKRWIRSLVPPPAPPPVTPQ